MSGLILYTTEDGCNRFHLSADDQTMWLTQLEMVELFTAIKRNISLKLIRRQRLASSLGN